MKQIERIEPAAGIPGGEVAIQCANHSPLRAPTLTVRFSDQPAHVVAATPNRALVLVPDLDAGAEIEVARLENENSDLSQQLETRKLVERAKGILMMRGALDEQEAFRQLKELASSKRRKLIDIAHMILVEEEAARFPDG